MERKINLNRLVSFLSSALIDIYGWGAMVVFSSSYLLFQAHLNACTIFFFSAYLMVDAIFVDMRSEVVIVNG